MTCSARRRTRTIRSIARYIADDSGATAVEYAIIASMISLAIMGSVYALGTAIQDTLYNKIANAIATM